MNPTDPVREERETFSERPRPNTWAATPLDTCFSDEIRTTHYRDVFAELQQRAEDGAEALGLPEHIKDYLITGVMQRFAHESQLNNLSYKNRGMKKTKKLPRSLNVAYGHAMNGTGTPGEVLDVGVALQMPSVEMAKLSHIAGAKMNLLPRMRQQVNAAIVSRGGELYDTVPVEYSIISTDNLMDGSMDRGQGIQCITMTRKRTIGTLSGYAVKEKSQFIVRVDEESELDSVIAAQIRSLTADNPRQLFTRIRRVQGFAEAVISALEGDSFDVAIPISTTIYAGVEKQDAKEPWEHERTVHLSPARSAVLGSLATNASRQ